MMDTMPLPEQQKLLKAVLFELKICRRLDDRMFQAFLMDKSFRGEILDPLESVIKSRPWDDKLRQIFASLRRAGRGSRNDVYKNLTSPHFKQTMRMFEELVDWGPLDNDQVNELVVTFREDLHRKPATGWSAAKIALGLGGSLILGLATCKLLQKKEN